MKKITKSKSKAKAKSSSSKKSSPKKTKVKAKSTAKAKPNKKAKPVSKIKAKVKVKAVVKAKPVSKPAPEKARSVSKASIVKPSVQKQKEAPQKPAEPLYKPKPLTPVTNNKMPYQKDEGRKIIRPQRKEDPNKTRYSDVELEEFRAIINKKLEDAKRELATLQAQLTSSNDHGTDDTANTFKMLEDGSDSLAKEEAGQLASRQRKFIEQLENALVRIENKTYGICRVTGKLIPKERLRAVPHTTQSIEAKLNQYRD
jgi:DnaK suppressor protein